MCVLFNTILCRLQCRPRCFLGLTLRVKYLRCYNIPLCAACPCNEATTQKIRLASSSTAHFPIFHFFRKLMSRSRMTTRVDQGFANNEKIQPIKWPIRKLRARNVFPRDVFALLHCDRPSIGLFQNMVHVIRVCCCCCQALHARHLSVISCPSPW